MYEIPLLFVGSTLLLALALPAAAKSEHRWLPALTLGIYGIVQLFLLWVLRGWGRMAALILIGVEAAAWPWVPPTTHPALALSMPLLFALGWVGDWWHCRRVAAEPPKSN
jgi:hypothetical protein